MPSRKVYSETIVHGTNVNDLEIRYIFIILLNIPNIYCRFGSLRNFQRSTVLKNAPEQCMY